jgi:predicted ATPase
MLSVMVWLEGLRLEEGPGGTWPFTIPAVTEMGLLSFERPVTFLAGENGSGKSTILEAIAIACGCPADGGASNRTLTGPRQPSQSYQVDWALATHVTPRWRSKPIGRAFFLRAESYYDLATRAANSVDPDIGGSYEDHQLQSVYGDRSPHEFSHGEAFLELFGGRFGAQALYFLDEPEAPLSFRGCLSLLATIRELVDAGTQLIIATHSPVLLAYPDAMIYELGPWGIERRAWDETNTVADLRLFLEAPERHFRHLFPDE